jgi:DNA-binding NarL/FixJ family response regulator
MTPAQPPPPDPDAELRRPLSPREAQVAALLGRGLAYGAIGAKLGISVARVRAVVYAIADKLPDAELAPPTRAFVWAVCRAHWRGELRFRRSA